MSWVCDWAVGGFGEKSGDGGAGVCASVAGVLGRSSGSAKVEGRALKNATSKISSSLIYSREEKSAGLNAAISAGLTAEELRKGWGRKPLSVTASTLVSHAAKSVYDAIRFYEWKSGKNLCEEPEEVLAGSSNTSVRTVRDSLNSLEAAGFIKRERRSPGRFCGAVSTVEIDEIPIEQPVGKPAPVTDRCATCARQRVVNAVGICVICRKRATAKREVSLYLVDGPRTLEDCWNYLKAHGSKSSQKDIERAHGELNPLAIKKFEADMQVGSEAVA